MKWLFLLFLFPSSASAEDKVAPAPLSKEEEARKAAEVLGETYQPPKAGTKSEELIEFAPTEGMNDEEKDVVLANYERTKGEYKEDMSDSLFERISKAYVRNLDRILVKKKID